MPLVKTVITTIDGNKKRYYYPISSVVKIEGNKKPDTLDIVFPATNKIRQGDEISYIQDVIDITHLRAVYPMQLSCLDESGYDHDPDTDPLESRFDNITNLNSRYRGNYALNFTGDNQGVHITNTAEIDISKQFDIHIWFTPDRVQNNDGTDEPILLSFRNGVTGIDIGITGTNNNNDSWKAYLRVGSGITTSEYSGSSNGLIMTGTDLNPSPVHMRVKRGQDNLLKVYVNGQEEISQLVTQDLQPTSTSILQPIAMVFGDTEDSSSDEYLGLIHEIKVYCGTDLTMDQANKIRWSKPVIAYMKFAGRVRKITNNQVSTKAMCQSHSYELTKLKLGSAEAPLLHSLPDLEGFNPDPQGMVVVNGIIYILDKNNVGDNFHRVLAYNPNGNRVADLDFRIHPSNNSPVGITYFNNRFYILNEVIGISYKIFAYHPNGTRDPISDVTLNSPSTFFRPRGLDFMMDEFYVVTRPIVGIGKVYIFKLDGNRSNSNDIDLVGSSDPRDITVYNDKFYVVDEGGNDVLVYDTHGTPENFLGFELADDLITGEVYPNSSGTGIAVYDNKFYVVDENYKKVFVYTSLGERPVGDDLDFELLIPEDFRDILRSAIDNIIVNPNTNITKFKLRIKDEFKNFKTFHTNTDLIGGISEVGSLVGFIDILLNFSDTSMYVTPRQNIIIEKKSSINIIGSEVGKFTNHIFDQNGAVVKYKITQSEVNDTNTINATLLIGKSVKHYNEFSPRDSIRRTLRRNVFQLDSQNDLFNLSTKLLNSSGGVEGTPTPKHVIQSMSPIHHVKYNHIIHIKRKSGKGIDIDGNIVTKERDTIDEDTVVRQIMLYYPSGKTIINCGENDIDLYNDIVEIDKASDSLIDVTT